MKKLLLATSAIVLMAGNALADAHSSGISVSGSGNFGVKFSDGEDLKFHHEFDIKFSASGTTDGGLGFGAEVKIDNQEPISATTNTSVVNGTITPTVTNGSVEVMGTAAAARIRNRIMVDTSTPTGAFTPNSCYIYNGDIYTLAGLITVTTINEDEVLEVSAGTALAPGANKDLFSNEAVTFMNNEEVADALDKSKVSIDLVENFAEEFKTAAGAAKTFWENAEPGELVIHKISPADGLQFAATCNGGNNNVFDAGNLYNP